MHTSVARNLSVVVLLDAFVDRSVPAALKLLVLEPQAVVHTYKKYPTPGELGKTAVGSWSSQDLEDLLHARAKQGKLFCRSAAVLILCNIHQLQL